MFRKKLWIEIRERMIDIRDAVAGLWKDHDKTKEELSGRIDKLERAINFLKVKTEDRFAREDTART